MSGWLSAGTLENPGCRLFASARGAKPRHPGCQHGRLPRPRMGGLQADAAQLEAGHGVPGRLRLQGLRVLVPGQADRRAVAVALPVLAHYAVRGLMHQGASSQRIRHAELLCQPRPVDAPCTKAKLEISSATAHCKGAMPAIAANKTSTCLLVFTLSLAP